MNKSFNSKKVFYLVTIATLALWIIGTFIPTQGCEQQRFGPQGVFHWNVCENMIPLANLLYEIFYILALLGSAYAIVMAVIFFKSEFR